MEPFTRRVDYLLYHGGPYCIHCRLLRLNRPLLYSLSFIKAEHRSHFIHSFTLCWEEAGPSAVTVLPMG